MASAEKLQEAIQNELDKIHVVVNEYEALNLDDLRQKQLSNKQNVRAIRAWRLNIARNIQSLNDTSKKRHDLYDIVQPQIDKLNELLATELIVDSENKIDEFYSLRSSILNSRRMLAALYAARKKYIPKEISEDLQSVLQETRSISEKVRKQRNNYREQRLVTSEEVQGKTSQNAGLLARRLNSKLPLEGVWSVAKRNEKYILRFDPDPLIAWGDHVATILGGYLEDNSGLTKNDIIGYILSNWGDIFADFIYQSVVDNSLSTLGVQLANKYRETSSYSQGMNANFRRSNLEVPENISPLYVAFQTRVTKFKLDDEKSVPKKVKEELLSYACGKFEITLNARERINDYSKRYNTLPIEVDQVDTKELDNQIKKIKRHLNELYALVMADVFGGQRNSEYGSLRIDDLKESILELKRMTTKTKDFRSAFYEFKKSSKDFEDWINGNWTQFGGTPSGKVHSMGGKWALAMGLAKKE